MDRLVLLEVAVQESVADVELSSVEIKAGSCCHNYPEGFGCESGGVRLKSSVVILKIPTDANASLTPLKIAVLVELIGKYPL